MSFFPRSLFPAACSVILAVSCADFERDSIYDKKSGNYVEENLPPSSSSSVETDNNPSSSSGSETQSSSSDNRIVGEACIPAYNDDAYYCSNGILKKYGSVTDDSGRTYKTVEIGNQIWMAENLNYNVTGSKCYGDNTGDDSKNNCETYGRLYDKATAMNRPRKKVL